MWLRLMNDDSHLTSVACYSCSSCSFFSCSTSGICLTTLIIGQQQQQNQIKAKNGTVTTDAIQIHTCSWLCMCMLEREVPKVLTSHWPQPIRKSHCTGITSCIEEWIRILVSCWGVALPFTLPHGILIAISRRIASPLPCCSLASNYS